MDKIPTETKNPYDRGGGRKPLPTSQKRKQRGIYLTDDEWQPIQDYSKQHSITESEAIRRAIQLLTKETGQ